MESKKLVWLLSLLFLFDNIVYAQQPEDRRMKIEMTVKQGATSTVALLTSTSISFARSFEQDLPKDSTVIEKPGTQVIRNFIMAIYFDKPDIQTIRAFISNKNGLDGQIIMTDTYGRLPSRKVEFKSAVLDALSDQMTNDYANMYINIRCSELIIDGLKMEL